MYEIFNSYILRMPRLPLNFYFDLVNKNVGKDKVFEHFNNDVIKEAIYIGSPHLYNALSKVCAKTEIDPKKKEKIRLSLLKYLYRISSRTTPFGLFSGLSLGAFSNDQYSSIKVDEGGFFRHSRLDIQVCFELVNYLKKKEEITINTIYYSNSSFYVINKSIRYLEKVLIKNKLTYQIVEILLDEYLDTIIKTTRKGKNKEDLVVLLTKSGDIEIDEATLFIDELISNQILVNELELTVSGSEPLDHIIAVLEKRAPSVKELIKLKAIRSKINLLDEKNNSNESLWLYKEIIAELKLFGIPELPKDIFQVDSYINHKTNLLSNDFKQDIHEGLNISMYFFNNLHSSNSEMEDFKKEFYKRYENEEVNLMVALDEEIGINYPVNVTSGDSNPLLKGLFFGNNNNTQASNLSAEWNPIDILLFKKAIECEKQGLDHITIAESDIKSLPKTNELLCDTFSSMIQIVDIDGQKKIFMPGVMGSSAANLMARFAHGNEQVLNYIDEIVKKENEINSDKIVAEIVHLAEKRLGNILMRPAIRIHEIPIATRSESEHENTVLLDDIFVKVENHKLILISRSKNKEILPRLTNAHNYSSSTLPVYKFLSDFQYYNRLKNLGFSWGNLNKTLNFFPRVYYKKLILSSSKWKIKVSELHFLIEKIDHDNLLKDFNEWRKKKGIPSYFYLSDSDNKLLIYSFSNDALIVFFNEIKKYQTIMIEEFLFEKNSFCQDSNNESYANEFIFSFYRKDEKVK